MSPRCCPSFGTLSPTFHSRVTWSPTPRDFACSTRQPRLSSETPRETTLIVIVIDDLQAADAPSIMFLPSWPVS